MTKHTEKAGPLPNASIDLNKVHANARSGKDDVYEGALSAQREEPKPDDVGVAPAVAVEGVNNAAEVEEAEEAEEAAPTTTRRRRTR